MATGIIRMTAEEVNLLIHSYLVESGFTHTAFNLRNEGHLQTSPLLAKHIPRGELIELLGKALLYVEVENHWRGDAITANCTSGFSLLEPHVCSVDAKAILTAPAPAPAPAPVASSQSQLEPTKDETIAPPPTEQISSGEDLETATIQEDKKPTQNGVHPSKDSPDSSELGKLTTPEPSAKRKVSPVPIDGPVEKRSKRDDYDMDVDSSSESTQNQPSTTVSQDISAPAQINSPTITKPVVQVPKEKGRSKSKNRQQGLRDDATDPNAILMLPGHKTEVFVCAWNPVQHGLLSTGSKDASVSLWNLPDSPTAPNEPFESLGPPISLENFSSTAQGDLTSLHWNAEGTLLAIGSYDSVLRICTDTGSMYFRHTQHMGPIFAVRFSKSGRWLLTASLDGTTCLWDVRAKRLHRQYRSHTDCCLDVDWLNETMFSSAGADEVIHIQHIDWTEPVKTLRGHTNEINQIKVNRSGTRLASCSDDLTTRVWRVDNISNAADSIPGLMSSDLVVVLQGHKHSVSTVAWCPVTFPGTNEMLCSTSFDGTARLWDSVTGDCLKIFTEHKRPVYALSFHPKGEWMATGSGDGYLHIYNVKTKEKKWSWYAGSEKPGVFEIGWQDTGTLNRIALALECRTVAVIDVSKIPSLQPET